MMGQQSSAHLLTAGWCRHPSFGVKRDRFRHLDSLSLDLSRRLDANPKLERGTYDARP